MHRWTEQTERLWEDIVEYARTRLMMDPVPLDGSLPADELAARVGSTITEQGLGGTEALRLFAEVLAPACLSIDHPRYLSFIPCAPTKAASMFDLVVGASSIYGGSWLEGAGAVHAENQALRWIADLAGMPASAGGVFVPGGTLGNLSALVAARHQARVTHRAPSDGRWQVAAAASAHSSVRAAAEVMDVDVLPIPTGPDGRLTGPGLRTGLADVAHDGLFAVVATAGSTNLGVVDDLAPVADVAAELGAWLHVDGAYGGAGLAAPSVRHLYRGVERADSLVVDPHKWLFAPFDACALLYRDPEIARAAHTQHAGYLEPVQVDGEWNPSDYAIHLTRRARGLPFWFSLATHGTAAYQQAIESTLTVARHAAAEVRRRDYLELVAEPDLSVVALRRLGWTPEQYYDWSARLLSANVAFVTPSTYESETITRIAVVNPRTSTADIDLVLDSMAG
ncbi:MAG: pyridoxal phosphate-dependent decarboxylase family protein [Actinomycetes bacterium]